MLTYLGTLKSLNNFSHVRFIEGFLMTISGILQLVESQSSELFYTYCFNQDIAENYFSQIRRAVSNLSNPSLHEFQYIFAKLVSIKIVFNSERSNCDIDDANQLDLEIDSSLLADPMFSCCVDEELTLNSVNEDNFEDLDVGIALQNTSFTSDLVDEDIRKLINSRNDHSSNSSIANSAFRFSIIELLTSYYSKKSFDCSSCDLVFLVSSVDNPSIDSPSVATPSVSKYNPGSSFLALLTHLESIFEILFKYIPHKEKLVASYSSIIVETLQKRSVLYDANFFKENDNCFEHRKHFLGFFLEYLIRKGVKNRVMAETYIRKANRRTKDSQRYNNLIA